MTPREPDGTDSSPEPPSAVDPAGGLTVPGGRCWRCGDPWQEETAKP